MVWYWVVAIAMASLMLGASSVCLLAGVYIMRQRRMVRKIVDEWEINPDALRGVSREWAPDLDE